MPIKLPTILPQGKNPVFERFFAKKEPILTSKFNDSPEMFLLKKRIIAEKYLAQTAVSSKPIFQTKGKYLLVRSIVLQDQSAVHQCLHKNSALRSANLTKSVVPVFNKLIETALSATIAHGK